MKYRLLLSVLLLAPLQLNADGSVPNSDWIPPDQPEAVAQEPVAPGSDAQFDKRLPPVLPGETVNDSGRRMKVWSTSGPVPVAEAPEPWKNKDLTVSDGSSGGGVGVIVDTRKDRHSDR